MVFFGLRLIVPALLSCVQASSIVPYANPVLPGWHSDPSCVFVAELENTFFCTTSSFMAFPGNPIYASQDLVSWKLASNALSRVEQLPEIRTATNYYFAGGGMFANTLRYHQKRFYLISSWINTDNGAPRFVMNTAIDPFEDASWTDMMFIQTPGASTIDPEIFFDDDGSVVVAFSGSPIQASYLDIATGNMSEPWALWNGTGGANAEGPHILKKDGYYYLLIAEGGTQLEHAATVARSRTLNRTWEASPHNPLVSSKGTNNYFQTVGHADLFHDANGNWWGVALSTRGGPALYNESVFPMGRETVLYPVSWPTGGWPTADQVRGSMSGPLPRPMRRRSIRGMGPAVGEPEVVAFEPGSTMPRNWVSWRAPYNNASFEISPAGHPNALQLTSSRANLTGDLAFNATREGLTAVFRRQEHTFFNYSVDLHLGFGQVAGDELGVSNFLNQEQHVDLGIVHLERRKGQLEPHLRFRARSVRAPMPLETILPIPHPWLQHPIRIGVSPRNESHFTFVVSSANAAEEEEMLIEYTTALIAGDGASSGGLLGVYATTNGGNHTFHGYVSNWRYIPVAQKIDYNVVAASR